MEPNIFLFILIGFVAQVIDGALGMAYGVSSTTMMLGFGVSPAAASASIHFAEICTSGVSGFTHWKLGNVDKRIVLRLLIPGAIGGAIGAYILTNIPEDIIRPFVSVYLMVMAVVIFRKVLNKNQQYRRVENKLFPLGLIGGFFDAIGGGGWGPIVTSTLLARGNWPRQTVGSVNLAEFGVTIVQSITFLLTIGFTNLEMVGGLIIGGVLAAPLAAVVVKHVPIKYLVNLVGFVIAVLGMRMMYQVFVR